MPPGGATSNVQAWISYVIVLTTAFSVSVSQTRDWTTCIFCVMTSFHALQAMATLGAVPHLVRLLESANEVIAEGASECLLHIVAPSDGHPAVHPSQLALRSAGAIPSLLSVVRLQSSTPQLSLRDFSQALLWDKHSALTAA